MIVVEGDVIGPNGAPTFKYDRNKTNFLQTGIVAKSNDLAVIHDNDLDAFRIMWDDFENCLIINTEGSAHIDLSIDVLEEILDFCYDREGITDN